jgi:hypothetical protein
MSDPFPDYFAVLAYAKVNDLEIAWEHSPPFRKWTVGCRPMSSRSARCCTLARDRRRSACS